MTKETNKEILLGPSGEKLVRTGHFRCPETGEWYMEEEGHAALADFDFEHALCEILRPATAEEIAAAQPIAHIEKEFSPVTPSLNRPEEIAAEAPPVNNWVNRETEKRKEVMNNPACAHLTIKWNIQDTGGSTHGWWACEMCHTLFVPQTVEPSLQQRLEQANRLQELTLQGQLRWMNKYVESEKAHQETHAALKSANSLCISAHSIAERKGSQTNWDSFIGQLKESLKIQHRVMYPEGRVVFPQPSPSPEQIKEAEVLAKNFCNACAAPIKMEVSDE